MELLLKHPVLGDDHYFSLNGSSSSFVLRSLSYVVNFRTITTSEEYFLSLLGQFGKNDIFCFLNNLC